MVLQKTLESPLDCKEVKLVNPKGNQHRIFIRSTDPEAEDLILWTPEAKHQLTEKDLDAEKVEGKRRELQKMRWLDSIADSMDMNLSKLQGTVKEKEAWSAAVHWGLKELDTT